MKRILILFMFLSLLLLFGCNINKNKEKTNEEIVNELLKLEYESIDVSVKTTRNEYSLNKNYHIISKDGVLTFTYEVEEYNTININNPDSEEKTVKTGKIEVVDGQKRVIEGEDIDINSYISLKSLKFDEKDFDEVKYEDDKVILKANNAQKYLNSSLEVSDFCMIISYSKDGVSSINITYNENHNIIEINYLINK